jgi:hypothetical protein
MPETTSQQREEQGEQEPTSGGSTPGDQLRALPDEAQRRGTHFVSAEAMQARLFSVYDAAAAAEEALALVQQQLTLTLDRHYYEAEEIEELAAELDALLMLDALDLGGEETVVSEMVPEEDLVSEA